MRERIRRVLEEECYVGPYTSDRAVDKVLEALTEPTEGMINTQGKSRPDLAKTDRQRECAAKLNESVRSMAKVTFVEMIQAAREGK